MDGQRKARRAPRAQLDDLDLDFAMFDAPAPALPELDRVLVLRALNEGPVASAAALARRMACTPAETSAALRKLKRGRFVFADEGGWSITSVGVAEIEAAERATRVIR